MRGRIPDEILSELRDRASILEVVAARVGLRKVGRNHVGLCPFHSEKTPSFTVSEDRGIFHCFGCGAGGNVFTFLMRMESLTFPEVVERLAERYGVALPARRDDPGLRLREELFALNEKAARFFERHLWEGAEAEPARAYLRERGIGRPVADRFRLGYAPGGGDVLARRLRAAGASVEHALRLGLIATRPEAARHYDRFRARLMFPITDASGRIVGFGSRVVPGTASARGDAPKYVNSPETPLYRKGSHLYGLAAARTPIRAAERALVVEGYFDVLALVEAGIEDVVASLGTALTLEQLQVLKRFTRDIVVVFDGDPAGQAAAERSLPTFLEAGLWGHAAFLPPGDDPDTYVRREGRDAALALIGRATTLFDFHLERLVRPGAGLPERARAAARVAQLLTKITDPFEYDLAARRAAERLGVAEELLRRRPGSGARATATAEPASKMPVPVGAPGPEEMLVTLMLRAPELALTITAADGFALFDTDEWRAIGEAIADRVRRGAAVDPATLLSRLDEPVAARVAGRMLDEDVDPEATARIVDDCLAKLGEIAAKRRRRAMIRAIRDHEARGEHGLVEQGLRAHADLLHGKRP